MKPTPVSCLEGAWEATAYRGHEQSDMTEATCTHTLRIAGGNSVPLLFGELKILALLHGGKRRKGKE